MPPNARAKAACLVDRDPSVRGSLLPWHPVEIEIPSPVAVSEPVNGVSPTTRVRCAEPSEGKTVSPRPGKTRFPGNSTRLRIRKARISLSLSSLRDVHPMRSCAPLARPLSCAYHPLTHRPVNLSWGGCYGSNIIHPNSPFVSRELSDFLLLSRIYQIELEMIKPPCERPRAYEIAARGGGKSRFDTRRGNYVAFCVSTLLRLLHKGAGTEEEVFRLVHQFRVFSRSPGKSSLAARTFRSTYALGKSQTIISTLVNNGRPLIFV